MEAAVAYVLLMGGITTVASLSVTVTMGLYVIRAIPRLQEVHRKELHDQGLRYQMNLGMSVVRLMDRLQAVEGKLSEVLLVLQSCQDRQVGDGPSSPTTRPDGRDSR